MNPATFVPTLLESVTNDLYPEPLPVGATHWTVVTEIHDVELQTLLPIDAVAVASYAPKLTPSIVSNDGDVVAMFKTEYVGTGASNVKPKPWPTLVPEVETVPTTAEMVRTTLCCTPLPALIAHFTNVADDHNDDAHEVPPIVIVPL